MAHDSKLKFFYQSEKIKLFAIIFLSAATLGVFEADDRYAIVQQDLLPNLDFQQVGRYWRATKGDIHLIPNPPATLVLKNDGRRQTFITQTLENPHRFDNFLISVEARFDGIEAGPAWWQKAGVLIQSYDGDGNRMAYWPSEVAFQSGTHPWHRYDAVIPASAAIKNMQIFILHGGKSGELRIRKLRIDSAEEAIWFSASEMTLRFLWFAVGAWILVPLFIQNRRAPIACMTLATFAGILAVSILPQPLLSTSSKPALDRLAEFAIPAEKEPKAPAEANTQREASKAAAETKRQKKKPAKRESVRAGKTQFQIKGDRRQYIAHFLSHAVLALLAGLAFSRAGWWRLSLCLLIAGATNELLQVFVITRSAGLADGMANIAGVGVGLLLIVAFRSVQQRLSA